MKLIIKPRIHVTLLSMHAEGYRKNGGLGFSIDSPRAELIFEKSSRFTITDNRTTPLSTAEIKEIHNIIIQTAKANKTDPNFNITIKGGLLTHYGMGSGTAIRLACIEGINKISNHDTSRIELIRSSKRGGTSGVGINTYFDGGMVFDLGVKNTDSLFYPSSSNNNTKQPQLLSNIKIPEWDIGLCIPKNIQSKSQSEEREFFARATPTTRTGTLEALYTSLFGVYAAAREKDLDTFCKAISKIQSCKWKQLERKEYGSALTRLDTILTESGAYCVGMSSLGPLLYFFAPPSRFDEITNRMASHDCVIIRTKLTNSGREIHI